MEREGCPIKEARCRMLCAHDARASSLRQIRRPWWHLDRACGSQETADPTAPKRFLTIALAPSDGDVAWERERDGWSVVLTPAPSWKAEFVAPQTTWNLFVVVRLFNQEGTSLLFESVAYLPNGASEGLAYAATGDDFEVASGRANRCGDDFTGGSTEVSLTVGSATSVALESRRVPCALRFSRVRATP